MEGLLLQARGDTSEAEWLDRITYAINENLTREPRLYVSYGPWWMALKNCMIAKGYDNYGYLVQADVAEIYRMSRDALTVCAAVLYQELRTDEGMVYSREHDLEVNESADDTEPYTYVLEDDEVDRIIQQRSNINGGTNQTP